MWTAFSRSGGGLWVGSPVPPGHLFDFLGTGGSAKTHTRRPDNLQTLAHLLRILKNFILLRSRRPGSDCSQRLRTKESKQGTDFALCPPPCPLQGLDFITSHQFRSTPAMRGPLGRRSQVKSGVRHHFVNENGHSLESAEGMAIVLMPLSSLRRPGSPHNSTGLSGFASPGHPRFAFFEDTLSRLCYRPDTMRTLATSDEILSCL